MANKNTKEWFDGAMAESRGYTRSTAWQEAEVVSAIADLQGSLKFGIIDANEALARLAALRGELPDIVAIIEDESSWLADFETSLIEAVYGNESEAASAAAA